MKKLIVGLFIFGFIAISAPQVHASILSDALLKIQNLQKEVSSLKSKLGAYALGYTPSYTNLDSSTSLNSSSGTGSVTVNDGCANGAIYSYTTGAKCPNVAAPITPTTDPTPRISYWSGKVNQHVDLSAQMWQTDADGVSGADIDKLTYCKKWYPKTTSVVEYKNETINAWHDKGNINDYQNTRMSYRCAETTIDLGCSNGQVYSSTTGAKCLNNATPSLTVLSPNGGETYNAGDKVTVKWKSIGYSSNSKISIDLATTDSNGSSTNTHLMSVSNLDDDGVATLTIPNDVKTGSNYVLVFTIFETSTKWQMAKSNLFTIKSISNSCIIKSFKVNNSDYISINNNEGALLTWETSNCIKVLFSNISSDIPFPLSGSQQLYHPLSTDYIMTAYGNNNTVSKSVHIEVLGISTTPSITVLSPNGGENFNVGNTMKINWTSNGQGTTGTWSISLVDTNGHNYYLTPNNFPFSAQSLSWTTPSADNNGVPIRGQYKIRVSCSSNGNAYCTGSASTSEDLSDNYFTINSSPSNTGCSNGEVYSSTTGAKCLNNSTPSITVLSPNGGESYVLGQDFVPRWNVSGMSTSDEITVELEDTITKNQIVIGKKFGTDTTVGTKLPVDSIWGLGNHYKIRITAENSSGNTIAQDYSDNLFTINSTDGLPAGCTSNSGYSSTTGVSCGGSQDLIDNGCADGDRYSKITGQLCGTTRTNTTTTTTNPTKRILRWGLIGDDVKSLQEFLGIDADGVYGRGTASKVKEWQASQGLYADGVFGNTSRQTAGLE
ncbi:MAG: Ser-Thr-rich GPI-anchored membrane family protein [Candidatus Paceibacterota bacterium]|jgi:hypothetical protein